MYAVLIACFQACNLTTEYLIMHRVMNIMIYFLVSNREYSTMSCSTEEELHHLTVRPDVFLEKTYTTTAHTPTNKCRKQEKLCL